MLLVGGRRRSPRQHASVASNTSSFASSPDGLVGTTEITAPAPVVVKENVSTSVIRSMMPEADRLPSTAVKVVAVANVPP